MQIEQLIKLALEEDIGSGDITTDYLYLPRKNVSAYLIAKEDGILCGLQIALQTFQTVDNTIKFVAYKKDGDFVRKGESFAKIEGYSSSILKAERVALNFLQRLSGIATLTSIYVAAIKPYQAKLLDTRKTTPLLRSIEKYAVRIGGGYNHRFGLYDMILIKENHIKSYGNIFQAIINIKQHTTSYKVVAEVTNSDELRNAVMAGADRVLLDNMSLDEMHNAVQDFHDMVEIEASGNVTLSTITDIASTGVHYISCGALTHSYRSLDISLLIMEG